MMTWHFCYSERIECVCAACAVYETVKRSDTYSWVWQHDLAIYVCAIVHPACQVCAQNYIVVLKKKKKKKNCMVEYTLW